MVEKHLKECLTSLDIKELYIKTTLKFHIIPTRMTKIKKLKQQLVLTKIWIQGNTPLLVGVQACTTALEVNLVVSQDTGNRSTSSHSSGANTQKNLYHPTKTLAQLCSQQLCS